MIVLESSRLRLTVSPERGVQWNALEARAEPAVDAAAGAGADDASAWTSLVPDCRPGSPHPRAGQDESTPLEAALFHMIPYSNRVRDGRFTFDGTAHELPEPERHAIHGVVRKRPWKIASHEARRLVCTFDSADHDGAGWPWPIACSIAHEVDGGRLRSTMSLTNRGDAPMPAGMGWHPYFVREMAGAPAELTLPVSAVWPDADGDCLPEGAPVALPPTLDFRTPRVLDPAQHIDCCLAGLDGAVRIRWPGTGLGLTLRADAACAQLILFNPGAPHFAVEPVTNANDGFNLESRGIDAGVRTLAPGETLETSLELLLD